MLRLASRLFVLVPILCLTLVAFEAPAMAGSVPGDSADCTQSLYNPTLNDSAFSYWSNDTSYTVTKTSDDNTHLDSYYVSGDTIRINEDQFPSLARPANAPNTAVKSITFDARLIILDMPIVFDSTSLSFFAERVVFTNRAAILFNSPMPQSGGDGVLIVTDEFDLSSAKTRPFQFKTDNWEFLTDGSQKPWPAENRRTINVSANRVVTSDPLFKDDLLKFFRNLTLDQKYGYAPAGLSSAPYTIHVADDMSIHQYDTNFSKTVLWPDELAAKVTRQFARAPFDSTNTEFLQTTYIRPYIQKFESSHSAASLRLNDVATAIRLGRDTFGQERYYVPRFSLDTVLQSFNDDLTATLKTASDWDAEVVKGFVGGPIDEAKVNQLRDQLSKDKTEIETAADNLGKSMASLTEKEQGIGQQLGIIKNHEDQLQAKLAELIAKDETNKKLQTATRVVAVVASLIPATAPVGIALGSAVLVTGDLVYKHNANQAVTGQSVISVVQTGVDFVGKVRAFRDSWDKLHTAIEKTQDPSVKGNDKRAEVNKAFIDAGRDFADKGKSVYKLLQVPEPTPLSLNELEKQDADLQQELQKLAALRVEESKDLTNVKELTDIVSQKTAVLISGQQQFYELLRADLRNDNYIVRQRNLALQIRDRLFEHLSYEASTLRRAYAYHTGRQLDAPADIVFFADDYKTITLNRVASADVAKTLSDQRLRAEKAYEALSLLAKNGQTDYLSSRSLPLITVKLFTADSANINDPEQVEFLKVLNKSIADGAAVRKDGTLVNKGAESFYVPFEDCQQGLNLPTKLLHIQVTSVVFESKSAMSGKTIELPVAHPGYGFVSDKRGCFYVDHRKADALQNDALYGTTIGIDGPINIKDVQSLYPGTLADLNKFAKYPFCSKYFAYLTLKGSPKAENWKQVPKIKHIEISFYSIQ
jgi:hypothetical protein